jgi:hypothetical protein
VEWKLLFITCSEKTLRKETIEMSANMKKTASDYKEEVDDLLKKSQDEVEKAVLPTVADIYSYPHKATDGDKSESDPKE